MFRNIEIKNKKKQQLFIQLTLLVSLVNPLFIKLTTPKE